MQLNDIIYSFISLFSLYFRHCLAFASPVVVARCKYNILPDENIIIVLGVQEVNLMNSDKLVVVLQ
ncbi:hypothetical protein CUU64_16735 [Bacillus sp. V5-8f]|nr:hypothetical protein CUU64_16735 [Bacillus sp. V5-8f]